ncbi:hypothetical protein FIV34_19850 [Luteibacter pinisoli]|uniref:Uncharacterized protein n=1 Tax=Luteibacter pinisoli TaxID=2589080 RepID=A0A4Y5Z8J3_9GAMM|nr:hypothetical protein [Luteibacter pinisoli]QDE41286.1 hypothetical protein FIV34_19850 [Luteibacter pinisoli]
MKLFGRSKMAPDTLLTMDEVTFLAGPEQLRSLAQFFLSQAEKQEAGTGRDHEHYSDTPGAIDGDHEVIVADPKILSG